MKYLVKKAQKGDQKAFVELMELYKQDLYKVAKSYLRSDEDAADAIQDTILSCYEHLKDLREIRYFKTWMIRILINKCKDILEKKICLLESFPEQADPHSDYQNSEFELLMDILDEKYRIILTLYYAEGFTTKEIAQILDISDNTVKTRLARGRKKIAEEICCERLAERRQQL